MPTRRLIFPAAGKNTRTAFQSQPPYTTRDCLNVIPEETIAGRDRGGSRPGLSKDYVLLSGGAPVALGSGSPVNLLASVRKAGSAGPGKFVQDDMTTPTDTTPDPVYWDNTFDTGDWTFGGLWAANNLTVDAANDYLENTDTDPSTGGYRGLVMRKSGGSTFVGTSDINFANPFRVEMQTVNADATYGALNYRRFAIHLFMAATTPNPSANGVTISFDFTPQYASNPDGWPAAAIRIDEYVDSSLVGSVSSTRHFGPGAVLSLGANVTPLGVDASNNRMFQVALMIDGFPNIGYATTALDVSTLHRIAVSMGPSLPYYSTGPYPDGVLSNVSLQYTSASSTTLPPEVVVASSNGTLYRESLTLGTVAAITTDNASGIELADAVSSVQRLGKLYIADYDLLYDETTSTTAEIIQSGSNWLLHDTTKTFSSDATITVDVDRVEITAASDNGALGTYTVHVLTDDTHLQLASDYSGGAVTGVSYRILCGPKVYDPSTDTLSIWSNDSRTANDAQAIPIACKIVTTYKDRMVLAGDGTGAVFMSRAGYPTDWDFSQVETDETRAIGLGAADGNTAGLPEAVTAVIPHSDDYLLISSKNTFWVLRGDPGSGGVIDNLSHTIGCISRFAWCSDPQNGIFFLSNNGIYYQPSGATVPPQKLSKEFIPQSLLSVDLDTIEPLMVYSDRRDGAYIFLPSKTAGPMEAWFFDSETAGFFPIQYADQDHHPHSAYHYSPATLSFSKVLFGCRDGFIRSVGGDDDDGAAFSSSLLIGPINLGFPGGMVKSLHGILGAESDDVSWSLFTGPDAEGTTALNPRATGTWSAGDNYLTRPNAIGRTGYLQLTTTGSWALEAIDIETKDAPGYRPI